MEQDGAAILPISLVPSIPYLAAICQRDRMHIDGFENYVKQTIRNRYHILTGNGVLALTIPVESQKGAKIPTKDIRIDYSKPWLTDHLRTIESAYRNSPFYDHYIDNVAAILSVRADTIGDFFNQNFQKWMKMVKIEAEITMTEQGKAGEPQYACHIAKSPGHYPSDQAYKPYMQVFADRFAFQPHLSIIDLVFNEGPASRLYIENL